MWTMRKCWAAYFSLLTAERIKMPVNMKLLRLLCVYIVWVCVFIYGFLFALGVAVLCCDRFQYVDFHVVSCHNTHTPKLYSLGSLAKHVPPLHTRTHTHIWWCPAPCTNIRTHTLAYSQSKGKPLPHLLKVHLASVSPLQLHLPNYRLWTN